MLLIKQTDQLIRNERSNAKFIDTIIANVVSLTDSTAKKQLEYDATIEFTNKPASDPPADTVEYIFPVVPSAYNPIVAIHHHQDLFQFELQDGQKSQLKTDKVLSRMSMTTEELMSAAKQNGG